MSIYSAKTGIIYSYTNKVTGRKYVGQTINPEQRKRNHLHEATVLNSDYYFHRSIRKHGWENFDYEVLEEGILHCDLNTREIHYIKHYNTLWPNGYNQCLANSLDESALLKMKATKKAKLEAMNQEEKRNLTRSMVEKNKGSKRSEETRKKMSESVKRYLAENPRVHSEERKRKTSETMKRIRAEKQWSSRKKEGK